jgi:hypothetical protein
MLDAGLHQAEQPFPHPVGCEKDPDLQHMVRALAVPATRGDLFSAIMDVQAVLEALSHFEIAFVQRDSEGIRNASLIAQKTLREQEERMAQILEDWKNAVC